MIKTRSKLFIHTDFGTLFVLLTSVLVGQAVSYSYSYSSTIIGDVRVQTLNNGSLYCDSLICPQGTATCKVTKRNDPNNFEVIVRHRRCLDRNGAVLVEEKVNEPNTYHSNVNSEIVSGAGIQSIQGGTVRQMTPQEQRELDEQLRLTQERVQAQIAASMNRLNRQLAPFQDGSFAANLNNQIQTSIRNSFY